MNAKLNEEVPRYLPSWSPHLLIGVAAIRTERREKKGESEHKEMLHSALRRGQKRLRYV